MNPYEEEWSTDDDRIPEYHQMSYLNFIENLIGQKCYVQLPPLPHNPDPVMGEDESREMLVSVMGEDYVRYVEGE